MSPTASRSPRTATRRPLGGASRRAVTETPALAPLATVTSPEPTAAVTPARIAVGFGMIAGIVLLVLGSRRGRGKG